MSCDEMNRSVPVVESLVEGPGWIGIMSQWVLWRVFHLTEFLGPEGAPFWLWRRGKKPPKGLKAISGIGYKRSSDHARVLCKRWGIPYIALEDGFLRSSSLGVEGDTPMSMVVDPIGIHYLSDRPSLLENILQQPERLTAQELATASELIALMRSSGIGKYNNAPDLNDDDTLGRQVPLILVVDQTYGDFSIPGGGLCEADFIRMLDTALAENPGADVRVRIHPDCVSGHKKSCLLDAAVERGVVLESRNLSWASLARRAARVYIATSQAGLEALIQGVPVTCFGLPFYAGWGLTDDRLAVPRRQARPSLEQLVAAAYIRYCRYVDPLTDQLCDVMTVAHQLARQKEQDTTFAGPLTVLGVTRRDRPHVRRFLASRWGSLNFARDSAELMSRVAHQGGKVLVWATREPENLQARAEAHGLALWRLEHGFLRSPEAGGVNTVPTSMVLDRCGIHFEARQPSDLETDLQQGDFDPATLEQASRLRERIVATGVSHYPQGKSRIAQVTAQEGQRRILVPGQIEDQGRNLQLLEDVRAVAPDAWIGYKPHPQVAAGTQPGSVSREQVMKFADQLVVDGNIASLYGQVDEVHTLTSTAGFEALLHGLEVVTYGAPFYAGWGLTKDQLPLPRRTRRATLDELVAAALLRYPRYTDRRTNLPCTAWQALEHASTQDSSSARYRQVCRYLKGMFAVGR
jgi:capsular polysaccharide export protein